MLCSKLLTVLCTVALANGSSPPGLLSPDDVVKLTRTAFRARDNNGNPDEVLPWAQNCGPDAISTSAVRHARDHGVGVMHAEYYVIHRRTGEVWDVAGKRVTSPELRRIQAAIRRRAGISFDEVERIRSVMPKCLANGQAVSETVTRDR